MMDSYRAIENTREVYHHGNDRLSRLPYCVSLHSLVVTAYENIHSNSLLLSMVLSAGEAHSFPQINI